MCQRIPSPKPFLTTASPARVAGFLGEIVQFLNVGKHTMQYTDDILKNCTLEIYIILLTNVTSI